ncbi:MAG: hypothetical protein A2458_01810 [Candidatus Kerfeldbacteria bacterium RIFOXYC2_FULL_38_9]|uniref:3D domain-containing protein n=1 Tax=Candidatus Kerfeldbacteria bacterium RIFOXYB2_FULL_38_14 TaxID=1798547 RepID=A0A1G2BDB1_9BACT|nr:MAG: hypothetical protein A2319_01100 [Candidatus Kerfeldbacteria bacterium RIFOXYB2_FULL_38_14]OGY88488.1 MAG: hypothetical protein A2458_01810 [Candidatus Kerfeldbacteria bacterium RIFOXYC2_FULL_38_9]
MVVALISYNILLPIPAASESSAAVKQTKTKIVKKTTKHKNINKKQKRHLKAKVKAAHKETVIKQKMQRQTPKRLPLMDDVQPLVVRTFQSNITYYASTPGQTDSNPFITASGSHVHWGGVAHNCLPFGTKIRIPEIYGDQIFIVEDRHSTRYGCRLVDVWTDYSTGQNPRNGHNATIEVLEDVK